jgi:hypothetical protein
VEHGRLRARARFIVVPGLAAEGIPGCQLIKRHVRNILQREQRITPFDDSVVSILSDSEAPTPSSTNAQSAKSPPPSTKVRVVKLTTLAPCTENLVWVQCAATGLRFLQALSNGNALGVYLASVIAEIMPLQPFTVFVINASSRERKLPKGMILGQVLPHPMGIGDLAGEDDSSPKLQPTETTANGEPTRTEPADQMVGNGLPYAVSRDPPAKADIDSMNGK